MTVACAVTALALAGASVALAAFTQVANLTLTAHRAGQSTGIRSDVHSSDPTALGQKPKSARSLTIAFPANTGFNLSGSLVKTCTLSDKQLAAQFGPSCPRNTQIGTGSAVANASPLASTVNAAVKAYVGGPNNIILVVKPTLPGAPTIIIRARAAGSTLMIPVPQLVLGKAPGFPGVKVVLVSLKLSVPAIGSGRGALISAGKCTAHRFVVTTHFVYVDHTTLNLQSSSPCS